MAKIKAFKGYRFNPEKIENLGRAMVPPFDTISYDEQKKYYEIDEHNFIRISKGLSNEEDNELNNCYTRANDYLKAWIKDKTLIRDKKEVLYLYEQKVQYKNTTFVNHGIVALLELSEIEGNEVMTCESSSLETARDRYNLLSATNSNVDMINCMYIDPEKSISSFITDLADTPCDMEFDTEEEVINANTHHKIWVIDNKKTINFIAECLADKTFFITDGHNRYVTALEYKNAQKLNNPKYTEDSDCNYIMAICTNAFGNRMVQLPVHRMLSKKKKFNEDFFIACAQDHFKIEKIIVDTANDTIIDIMKKQIATLRRESKFAVYCGGDYFYRLTFKDKDFLKRLLPDSSSAYCDLDVTVFNKLILEDILNISEEDIDEYVTYTKRATKGVKAVTDGEASCLFVLNPVKAEQIREVALSGEIMPKRSIYIFPKPATGVIINKFTK